MNFNTIVARYITTNYKNIAANDQIWAVAKRDTQPFVRIGRLNCETPGSHFNIEVFTGGESYSVDLNIEEFIGFIYEHVVFNAADGEQEPAPKTDKQDPIKLPAAQSLRATTVLTQKTIEQFLLDKSGTNIEINFEDMRLISKALTFKILECQRIKQVVNENECREIITSYLENKWRMMHLSALKSVPDLTV
jgi:hypothetical protein